MRCRLWLCVVLATGLAAAAGAAMHEAPGRGIAIAIDGEPQAYDVAPMMMGGRVMVPMRGIFESLQAQVGWDAQQRMVTATRGETRVRLRVGERQAMVDGRAVMLDAPPRMHQGRVMVPLRFVSESLGANVEWDGAARKVMIMTPGRGMGHMAQAPRAAAPTVNVSLVEWAVKIEPSTVKAGAVKFEARNDGRWPHALAIQGMSDRTRDLAAGERATLTVELKPGKYVLYCPIGNHQGLGMETTLTVQ